MPIKAAAPRTAPQTKAPAAGKGKAAETVPAASSSAMKRYETKARLEWDAAPQARGWGSSREEMRELEKEPMETQQGTVSDVRAYTLSQWMAWRVPQLKSNEDNVQIPSWR